MYTIKYGSKTINDLFSVKDAVVTDVTLSQNRNEFAYLDFKMAVSHPLYDEIKINDLSNIIQVLDDRTTIFVGYVYEIETNFELEKTIKCKDAMSYLEHSIVKPYSTKGGALRKAPSNPILFLKYLLERHNELVPNPQRIYPGNIGVTYDSEELYITNIEYPNTFDEIMDKIVNVYGGYLKTRYVKGVCYLDYLHEPLDTPDALLDFGETILDITKTINSEGLVSYIIPTGATIKQCYEENGSRYDFVDGYFPTRDLVPNPLKTYYTPAERPHDFSEWEWKREFDPAVGYYEYDPYKDESEVPLTLNRVTGLYAGKLYDDIYLQGDIIYKQSLIDKYGFIGARVSNTELTTVQDLCVYGITQMAAYSDFMTNISVKAVDLKLISGKPIGIGDHVRIRSKLHGVDNTFECSEINIDISSPENTTYQFGITLDTLTNSLDPVLRFLDRKINKYWDEV